MCGCVIGEKKSRGEWIGEGKRFGFGFGFGAIILSPDPNARKDEKTGTRQVSIFTGSLTLRKAHTTTIPADMTMNGIVGRADHNLINS